MSRPIPRIGCSGWNYKTWRATFYPKGLSPDHWLEFYASCFDTVEINSTFYRLPDRDAFSRWRAQTRKGFLFAVKGSRFLTHMKRLREPREPVGRLFSRVSALGRQLGPVLFQLPGNFTIDLQRLDAFLAALPRLSSGTRIRPVMEFRHPSWYVAETYHLLNRRGVALCLHDKAGSSTCAFTARAAGTTEATAVARSRRGRTAWRNRRRTDGRSLRTSTTIPTRPPSRTRRRFVRLFRSSADQRPRRVATSGPTWVASFHLPPVRSFSLPIEQPTCDSSILCNWNETCSDTAHPISGGQRFACPRRSSWSTTMPPSCARSPDFSSSKDL
jgi:uncharacterized protein YecE (DUF72 family)